MACPTQQLSYVDNDLTQHAPTSSETGRQPHQDENGGGTNQEDDYTVDALHVNLYGANLVMSSIMYDEYRGIVSMSFTEAMNRRLKRVMQQLHADFDNWG